MGFCMHCTQHEPGTSTWSPAPTHAKDHCLVSSNSRGQGHQHGLQSYRDYRHQFGPQQLPDPWISTWPQVVAQTTARPQTSTWPQVAAQATHISMALCGSTTYEDQRGFRWQHRPWTFPLPQVITRVIDINMASGCFFLIVLCSLVLLSLLSLASAHFLLIPQFTFQYQVHSKTAFKVPSVESSNPFP